MNLSKIFVRCTLPVKDWFNHLAPTYKACNRAIGRHSTELSNRFTAIYHACQGGVKRKSTKNFVDMCIPVASRVANVECIKYEKIRFCITLCFMKVEYSKFLSSKMYSIYCPVCNTFRLFDLFNTCLSESNAQLFYFKSMFKCERVWYTKYFSVLALYT